MTISTQPVGALLRQWRQHRRLSQMDLACEADVSTRHVSFVETGRSLPSRELVLRLAERLDVPLRERNALLTAAGYAPLYPERPLGDPAMRAARGAVELVLAGHEPYPALAVDRHWTMVASNRAVAALLVGIDASLLQPPVNVLRLSLHPDGLAPRIANLAQWRAHLLERLQRQVDATADPALGQLLRELRELPSPQHADCNGGNAGNGDGSKVGAARSARSERDRNDHAAVHHDGTPVVIPLRLRTGAGLLSFFSTTTIFGTPVDITLSELAIESFFPADAVTAQRLLHAAGGAVEEVMPAEE